MRQLGIEPLFSEIKESGFQHSQDVAANSIETCLANVRASDVVIVILSQRYGPSLGVGYNNLSATHCEYREAKSTKPIHFYVRSQLAGEWSSWKKNGKQDNFKAAWAKESDAISLFHFIDEHQVLLAHPKQSASNWFWNFSTSVDLCSDVRRRLAPQAFHSLAEKLINSGDMPMVMTVGTVGQECTGNFGTPHGRLKFEFHLANVMRSPALSPKFTLICAGEQFRSNSSLTVLSEKNSPSNVIFEIPSLPLVQALEINPDGNQLILRIRYLTPQGYEFEDCLSYFVQREPDGRPKLSSSSLEFGKRVIGMQKLILAEPADSDTVQ